MGTGRPRNGTLMPLLDRTPLAAYWIGFLLADGYFHEDRKVVGVTLWNDDAEHLVRLSSLLGGPKVRVYGRYCRVELCHPEAFDLIIGRIGSLRRKTQNPPDVASIEMTDEEQFALIVGYIDGDGHIKKTGYSAARIKGHISWMNNYRYWYKFWNEYLTVRCTGRVRSTSAGYAVIDLTAESIGKAKERAIELGLPILARKWDCVSPQKRYKLCEDDVRLIISSDLTTRELSMQFNVSDSTIQGIRAGRIWKRYQNDAVAEIARRNLSELNAHADRH